MYLERNRITHTANMAEVGLNDRWFFELQGIEHRPQAVITHICHTSTAEIVPAAEYHISIVGMIGAAGFRPQPQIPIQTAGNGRSIGGHGTVLRPYRAVCPV